MFIRIYEELLIRSHPSGTRPRPLDIKDSSENKIKQVWTRDPARIQPSGVHKMKLRDPRTQDINLCKGGMRPWDGDAQSPPSSGHVPADAKPPLINEKILLAMQDAKWKDSL